MTVKHNAAFERAVRIEMLRARAELQRQQLVMRAQAMAAGLSPSRVVANALPGHAGQWLSRGLSLMTRYPYVVTTLLSNRRFKAVRWLSLAALAVGAWALLSGRNADQTNDD